MKTQVNVSVVWLDRPLPSSAYHWPSAIPKLHGILVAAVDRTAVIEGDDATAAIVALWVRALEEGQAAVEAEIREADAHQRVHLHAVATTFCATIEAILEGIFGEDDVILECDQHLAGLICCGVVNEDGHRVLPRSIDGPIDRRGRRISQDEVAECYRVSRVAISSLEKCAIQKLRRALGRSLMLEMSPNQAPKPIFANNQYRDLRPTSL